jgi:predicted PolB exonuclease-like 3'-5' exonuclease
MDGSRVWEAYQQGQLAQIRNYCETDVANTYLVYARFQMMRGVLSPDAYRQECELVRGELASLNLPHWQEFLAAWPEVKC